MSRKKSKKSQVSHGETPAAQNLEQTNRLAVDTGRGTIKDNYLAALVTSKVYRMQVVKAKKGKGAFTRRQKHKGKEPYLMAA